MKKFNDYIKDINEPITPDDIEKKECKLSIKCIKDFNKYIDLKK